MVSSQAGQAAVDAAAVQECLHAAQEALSAVLLADPGNRAEAKSWLTSTVAHLPDISAATKLACFSPVNSSSMSADRNHHEGRYNDGSSQQYGSYSRSRSNDRRGRSSSEQQHSRRSRSRSRSRDDCGSHSSQGSHKEQPYQQQRRQRQQQQPNAIASCKPATLQLLQLLTDAHPPAVAQLLSQDPNFLCDYLTSNPAVTSSWFNYFSLSGIQTFKFGSRALANYALTHRSEIWQYLIWTGKHDQAPVAVAAKPHYFAELDMPKSLRNLAKYCPEFWRSDELLRSCESGEWLKLNSHMITEELYHILHNDKSSRQQQLLQLLEQYILAADWSVLCNRLLLLLMEQQLLDFARLVAQQHHHHQQQQSGSGSPLLQHWIQQQATYNAEAAAAQASNPAVAATDISIVGSELPCVTKVSLLLLSVAEQCSTLDQVLLANALSCHRGQLLKLLQQDDDTASQLLQLVDIAQQLFTVQQQQQQQVEEGEYIAAAPAAPACIVNLPVAQVLRQQAAAVGKQSTAGLHHQLLLVGWLLRLHILLAAATTPAAGGGGGGGAAASGGDNGDGGRQLQPFLQQLGCRCHILADSSGVEQQQHRQVADMNQAQQTDIGADDAQRQHGQHIDPQQQQQQQIERQIPDGDVRNPLRRGQPTAEQQQQQQKRSTKYSRKKRHRHKHRRKKREHKRSSTSGTDSDSEVADSTDSGSAKSDRRRSGNCRKHSGSKRSRKHSGSKHSRKHSGSKHSRKHRACQRSSSSSSSDDESERGFEMDYDAGGELLDPKDFEQIRTQSALTQHSVAAEVPSAAAAADRSSQAHMAAGLTAEQQHQQQVLTALERLSVGGQLHSGPKWLVGLPRSQTVVLHSLAATADVSAASAKAEPDDECYIWFTGSAVKVADVVAWYCVWRWIG